MNEFTRHLWPGLDNIKLLRIPFSLYLAPVFLLCLSEAEPVHSGNVLVSFLIIHLLVYPASNGYNSYIDRDTGSIGGLENPPLPTRSLYFTTLVMDLVAVLLSALLINVLFALLILIYILASRAYSSPLTRLKKHPWAGFFTVVFFQGAFTFYMSYAGITGNAADPARWIFILSACSFQIAGAYPLTQVYQHEQDKTNGDISLSLRLGYRGTFIFTGVMFLLCNVCYFLHYRNTHPQRFMILQVFFLPLVLYFIYWARKVWLNTSAASFKNTMRMNLIASVCTGSCFIFFILQKYLM